LQPGSWKGKWVPAKADPEGHAGSGAAREAADDGFRVIVGWSHALFSRGIQLRLQSRRAEGSAEGEVEDHRYLMTRNQALILARYLLESTGQTLPARNREGPLRRTLRRITGGG
jgi:hypothetical protein